MAVRRATRLARRALGRCRDLLHTTRSRGRTVLALRTDTGQRTVARGRDNDPPRGARVPAARPAEAATTTARPRGMRLWRADRPAVGGTAGVVQRLGVGTDRLASTGQPGPAGPRWTALVLSVAIVAWSFVANWGIGDAGYTTRNLLLTAAAVLAARAAGLPPTELGLSRETVTAGLRWGGGAVALIAAVIGAGVALEDVVPGVAALLADERTELEGATLATAVLVRIPFGTSLFEEVVFRGLLLAVMLRHAPPVVAAVASSVVFGLWHIAPTAVALELNDIAATSPQGLATITGAVAVTTVAGLAFTWLRLRSDSLLAPVLAHWATNALGLLAAAWR